MTSDDETASRSTHEEVRLNDFALRPLGVLHAEGWGPEAVEIDREAGEVKFVFTNALDTETDRSGGGA